MAAQASNSLYGSYPDGYKEKTTYMGSNLTAIPRGAPERRALAHNDCSESAYTGLHPNSHLSESTAYTGPTLTATRKNSLYISYPNGYPSGSPQKD